jgi:hypothetical protein
VDDIKLLDYESSSSMDDEDMDDEGVVKDRWIDIGKPSPFSNAKKNPSVTFLEMSSRTE